MRHCWRNCGIHFIVRWQPAGGRGLHTGSIACAAKHTKDPFLFRDSVVERLAAMPITPVTLRQLLQLGKDTAVAPEATLLKNANYLRLELPIRLAQRIRALQHLPFIIVTNPYISKILSRYTNSFDALQRFPETIQTESELRSFTTLLGELTRNHADVLKLLAKGMTECEPYITGHDTAGIRRFLHDLIQARIATRVLAEHHIALDQHKATDYVGIVATALKPATIVEQTARFAQGLCDVNYGLRPPFIIDGRAHILLLFLSTHALTVY